MDNINKPTGKKRRAWIDDDASENEEIKKPNNAQHKEKPLKKSKLTVSKPLANRHETVSEPIANRNKTVSKPIANRNETVSKTVSKKSAEALFFSLSEMEKKLIKFIHSKCQDNVSSQSLPISTQEIKQEINKPSAHIRNIIHRLIKKEALTIVYGSGGGANAYRVFKLDKELCKYLQNIQYTVSKTVSKTVSNDDVVSSSNINTNTTLPEEWNTLNIECLKNHGFNESHIIQIYRAYKKDPDIALPIEMIQESLYALSYDLECNADKLNIKKSPVLMITNMLKNGNPYSSITPESYLNPRELAIKRYQESKKLREAKLKQIEEDMFNSELEDWLNALDNSDRVKILSNADIPNNLRPNMKRRLESGHLKTHFEENVWSEIKQSVMSGNRETVS